MLVLTRKIGEGIVIGDDVRITILGIEGARVRIAIEAPPDVPVRRGEVEAGPPEPASGDNPPAS